MATPASIPHVFVSHNHQDVAFCRAYVHALRGYGYEVWYDEHNLGPGGELRRVIESQLQTREYFAVILSPAAVASSWVTAEIAAALELLASGRMRQVIPVIAWPCAIPAALQGVRRIEGSGTQPLHPVEAARRTAQLIAAGDPVTDVVAGRAASSRRSRSYLRARTILAAIALLALVLGGLGIFLAPRLLNPFVTIDPNGVAMVMGGGGGWIVGEHGAILSYGNGGWSQAHSPTTAALYAVAAVAPDNGWAVGENGTLLHYDGSAWRTVPSPTSATLRAVGFVSPKDGWAVGDRGTVLHDSAGMWSLVPGPDDAVNLSALAMISSSEGWVGGDSDSIFHYAGGHWTREQLPSGAATFLGMSATSAGDIWAVGRSGQAGSDTQRGVIFHDDGTRWSQAYSVDRGELRAVTMATPTDGWAVGVDGTDALVLHYDGAAWSAQPIATNNPAGAQFGLVGVAWSAPGAGWAVGQGGAILRASGGAWRIFQAPA